MMYSQAFTCGAAVDLYLYNAVYINVMPDTQYYRNKACIITNLNSRILYQNIIRVPDLVQSKGR